METPLAEGDLPAGKPLGWGGCHILIKNKINESTTLEYKDPRSLENKYEISKDVSAMANSDGGVIIYGLCDDDKDDAPDKIGWILDHKKIEMIEQVIQSRITPKIDGLKINKILNNDDGSKFIIVVIVPKSDTAPHQDYLDKDNRRYWRRNNYNIRQMEHYEIEDLFFKRKRPSLEVSLIDTNKIEPTYPIEILNKGKIMAEKIKIKLLIPHQFNVNGAGWAKIKEKYGSFGKYAEYQYFEDRFPFFPNVPSVIGTLEHPNKKYFFEELKIGLLVVCKDMDFKIYEIILERGILTKKIYELGEIEGIPNPYCKSLSGQFI